MTTPSFTSCEYWSNVLQNGIGCTLGSLLGASIALLIYYKQIKRDERTRKKIQDGKDLDLLKWFAITVESIVHTVATQVQYLDEFIKEMAKNPVLFPLMKTVPQFDLNRVVESKYINEIMLAYLQVFNSDNSIKEFKNILAGIDYLYLELQMIPNQLEKAQRFDFDRRTQLQSTYEQAQNLMLEYIAFNPKTDIAKEFKLIIDSCRNNCKNPSDLAYFNQTFFEPTKEYIYTLNSNEPRNLLSLLIPLIRSGRANFQQINAENLELSYSLKETKKSISNSLNNLKQNAEKLATLQLDNKK